MSVDAGSIHSKLTPLGVVPSPVTGVDYFIPAKNIYFSTINKKKLLSADNAKMNDIINSCHPSVYVTINQSECKLNIKPYCVDEIPGIHIIMSESHLDQYWIDFFGSVPEQNATMMTRINQLNAKASTPAVPKESFIAKFEDDEESFMNYCKQVTKSKIEFEKAKQKWPEQMKLFPKKELFVTYINSLKTAQDVPDKTNNIDVIANYHEFIRSTPTPKITKKHIKENYPELTDDITFLNLTGDAFKTKINELKVTLK